MEKLVCLQDLHLFALLFEILILIFSTVSMSLFTFLTLMRSILSCFSIFSLFFVPLYPFVIQELFVFPVLLFLLDFSFYNICVLA